MLLYYNNTIKVDVSIPTSNIVLEFKNLYYEKLTIPLLRSKNK